LTRCFLVAVKYLREVTPYFRKASIIQEVGWELQRGFLSATPPPPKSPPRADTRYLPLQLCRLTRAHPSSHHTEKSMRGLSSSSAIYETLAISQFITMYLHEDYRTNIQHNAICYNLNLISVRSSEREIHGKNGFIKVSKNLARYRERRFCCVECACLHDACDREHHFAVENVQLHSSRVENKQASLYSSPFRKLAGAFLDHELQKPVNQAFLPFQTTFRDLVEFPSSGMKDFSQGRRLLCKLVQGNRKLCEKHFLWVSVCSPEDLFPRLKVWLGGQKFSSNEEVIASVDAYFAKQDAQYYLNGLKGWEHR
ncbi:hypothetical protein ALC60_10859, partial [Trachymyrmex zeteki]